MGLRTNGRDKGSVDLKRPRLSRLPGLSRLPRLSRVSELSQVPYFPWVGPKATGLRYENPRRPLPIRALNVVGRLLQGAGVEAPALEADALMAKAASRTGLDDFGSESFREGLEVYLRSAREEAKLHPLGRLMAAENVVRLLSNRLRMEALEIRCPEVSRVKLESPVVIVGLQRTGTTLLQRLLANDPRFRVLASWEAINPSPHIERGNEGRDLDPKDTRRRFAFFSERTLRYMAPEFFAVHPVEYDAPEEDCLLFDLDFVGTVPEATQNVPTYSRWVESQDPRRAYRFFKRVLKMLLWQRPAERWLLKTPQHLEHLEGLLQELPGARILWTHRDPTRVLASFSSMMCHGRGVFSDTVDPPAVAAHWWRKAQIMIEHGMDVRDRWPDDTFLDVPYADLVADPLAQARRIYEFLGATLDPTVEARMRLWLGKNPQHKYGRHRYRLEDFRLDAAALEASFAPYRRRFEIPSEPLPSA